MNIRRPNFDSLLLRFALLALMLATPVVLAAQEKIVFSSNREGSKVCLHGRGIG